MPKIVHIGIWDYRKKKCKQCGRFYSVRVQDYIRSKLCSYECTKKFNVNNYQKIKRYILKYRQKPETKEKRRAYEKKIRETKWLLKKQKEEELKNVYLDNFSKVDLISYSNSIYCIFCNKIATIDKNINKPLEDKYCSLDCLIKHNIELINADKPIAVKLKKYPILKDYFKDVRHRKKQYYFIVCHCGNSFLAKRSNTKYCSKECKPKQKYNYSKSNKEYDKMRNKRDRMKLRIRRYDCLNGKLDSKCKICEETNRLERHHITYEKGNYITVCKRHHKELHKKV